MLETVFGATGHVTWPQECARAAVIFFYGLLVVRVFGRRIFGRWAALDITVSIVTGSNLSRALTGSADLWGTLLATTLLMALHATFSRAAARSSWISGLVEGRPITLGERGLFDRRALIRHGVSEADLDEALHGAGLADWSAADRVVLEPSGKIGVQKIG